MMSTRGDKLDYMIALAVTGCGNDDVEMFNNLDDSEVMFSEKHKKRYARLISKYKHKPTVIFMKRVFSRASVAILAILAAAFLTIMSISAFRNAVWKAIVEWYEDYITVHFEVDSAPSDDFSVASTNNESPKISVPTIIEKVYKPTYLPDGTEEEIVIQNDNTVFIDYYVGNDWFCSYKQRLLNDDGLLIDNEGVVIKEISINGNIATIYHSDNKTDKSILWNDGSYIYWIVSNCDTDTLVLLAESIQ